MKLSVSFMILGSSIMLNTYADFLVSEPGKENMDKIRNIFKLCEVYLLDI